MKTVAAVLRQEHWPDFPAERAAPLPATLQALQILTKKLFWCGSFAESFAECEFAQGMFGVHSVWNTFLNTEHLESTGIFKASLGTIQPAARPTRF